MDWVRPTSSSTTSTRAFPSWTCARSGLRRSGTPWPPRSARRNGRASNSATGSWRSTTVQSPSSMCGIESFLGLPEIHQCHRATLLITTGFAVGRGLLEQLVVVGLGEIHDFDTDALDNAHFPTGLRLRVAEGERSALTPSETRQCDRRPCQSRRMSEAVEMRAFNTPVIGDSSVESEAGTPAGATRLDAVEGVGGGSELSVGWG